MSAGVKRKSKYYKHFDGMCWPTPSGDVRDLQRRLVYGEPVRSDLLVANSVISAYAQLISLPRRERDKIIRELRKPDEPDTSANDTASY